jgi:Fic-DOC domain mobile mystery protein B
MKPFKEPEGATPLDQEELDDLKLPHITTRGELNRWEQDNINEAITWLEKRKNKGEVLNEDFISKLHKKMLGKVWQWAGEYRKSDKSIGVNKYLIGVELRQLLNDVKYWIENKVFNEDEIAARFHHRLVQIHLFPNGNGRHSRLMTDVLLKDVFGKDEFSWGAADLSEQSDTRRAYIKALQSADKGDYTGLMAFVRS